MKIIFFGTPHFAAEILSFLLDNECDVVAVVSKPDKPKGRSKKLMPTQVKELLLVRDEQIPLYQPGKASSSEFADILKAYQPDLFLVVAYGEIISRELLDIPRLGCVNIHASLLPKYRGAAPMQHALINGEKETGITLIEMSEKMDAGDVLAMEKIPVPSEMTLGELTVQLCRLSCSLLKKFLPKLEKGTVQHKTQDHSKATLAPKIKVAHGKIDWSLSASVLHNLIRGLSPFPGAWCEVEIGGQKRRLKILKSEVSDEKPQDNHLIVKCGKGSLEILALQLEGKRVMEVNEFLRGNPSFNFTTKT